MLHQTSGIILHTTDYSDSSIIAKIYTEKFGLQSYMISGARSKRSKTKAKLFQPLSIVELQVSNSQKSNLQRISEITVHHPYAEIPYNIVKSSIVLFLNEMLFRALKEEHPDEDLFAFISNSLLILDLQQGNTSNFHLGFLVRISKFFGFSPQGNYSAETPKFDLVDGKYCSVAPSHNHYLNAEESAILSQLAITPFEELEGLKITGVQRKLLLNALVSFFRFHIPSFGEIRSVAILEEVIG